MDTLAVDYTIPAIRACSGLSPVRQCSCREYQTRLISHMRKSAFRVVFVLEQRLYCRLRYIVTFVETTRPSAIVAVTM